MQDREFEKQVQQKMQELHFAPNAEVWARVQADIQKKKRRRPVIIWFLLAGLLLGGAGLWYSGGWSEKKMGGPTVQKENNVVDRTKNNIVSKTNIAPHKKQFAEKITQPAPERNQSMKKAKQPSSEIQKPSSEASEKQQPFSETKQSSSEIQPDPEIIQSSSGIQQPVPETKQPSSEATKSSPEIKKTSPIQKDSANKKDAGIAMKNKPAKQNKSWQLGITAGAGISDVGMQLLKGSRVADFAYSNLNATPSTYNPRRPSEITAGAAFQIGAYASKSIAKKLGVKLGLNYEYYSTGIMVGSMYNAPRIINQGTTMKMVEEFYTTGTNAKYTNKYHFVSLPVSLQWKMLDRKKYGLVWENGIGVSRLISATALHYDGISSTYYKDNNLFNKTQWTASSALLVSIKSKNLQFYAGPHVQYGISSLVDENNNHLRYAGLKLMTGFNKK